MARGIVRCGSGAGAPWLGSIALSNVASSSTPSPTGQVVPAASPFDRQHILLTLGLVLTVAAVAFETLAIATVLPAVVAELGGLHLYGWAFSAFLLAQLVAIVVAGLVADQRGPGLPFAFGVILFAIGLLVGGLAPDMPVLIGGRALQGLGGGAISAIAYVAIGRGYPESARPRMLALLSTAWVVPGLVGPALSGLIAEGVGWRAVFLALAPLPLITGGLAFPQVRHMPGGTPAPDARQRTLSAVVLAGGAGLFLAGLGNGQLLPALAMIVVGLVLLAPALRQLLPSGTLRAAPGLPATIATMGLLNLAFFGVDVFVPLSLVEVRGASVATAGLALTLATMAWSAGSWVQARTAERISRRTMTRIGVILLAVSFFAMMAVLFPAAPLAVGIVGWGFAGLGMGLAYTTLSLAMLELAEPGQEGEGSASLNLAAVLGSGFGAGIGGAFVALLHREGEPLTQALLVQDWVMLGVAVLAFVAARGLPALLRPAAA